MDVFITAAICLPVGIVAGVVLTMLFSGKVVNGVRAELETFKAEIRSRLK